MASVCVYCGSSPGTDPAFMHTATQMGICLAQGGHTLIYGGGKVGLMGAVADGALDAGGVVIGVIPEMLAAKELAHEGLTTLHTVLTMHERKFQMASLADVFIALPGGIGTLEEIIEIFVWAQLGVHSKPFALLNVNGFYDPLLKYLEHMAESRFLTKEHLTQLIVGSCAEEVLERVLSFRPISSEKWMDR